MLVGTSCRAYGNDGEIIRQNVDVNHGHPYILKYVRMFLINLGFDFD